LDIPLLDYDNSATSFLVALGVAKVLMPKGGTILDPCHHPLDTNEFLYTTPAFRISGAFGVD